MYQTRVARRVGVLADDVRVVDRTMSHIHLRDDELPALEYALRHIPSSDVSRDGTSGFTFRFPMPIGENICVPTTENDTIVYARRRGRDRFNRFVLFREPEPTHNLSVVLLWGYSYESCTLVTAHWGELAALQPQSSASFSAFWQNHALLIDRVDIENQTVTPRRPPEWA